jgi:type II secretory pathway pseudopilin PulG
VKPTSRIARVLTYTVNALLVGCILWIIAGSISLPRLTHARLHAQETAAIAAIRTILTAQTQYRSQFDHCAGSLQGLAAAGMIDARMASGVLAGYRFTISECTVSAVPTFFNASGSRTFTSDEAMVIHEHYGPEAATASDPKVQ